MGLINLQTNLKSLRYGNDRRGGGSSNQPYITNAIPDGTYINPPDFLLRQGALSFTDATLGTIPGVNLTARFNLTGEMPWWTYGALGPSGGKGGLTKFNVLKTDRFNVLKINDRTVSLGLPTDVVRISRFMFDETSPKGFLFLNKQLLLERQNAPIAGGPDRIYNPGSTLSQVGVLPIGYHLNKKGLDPYSPGYFTNGASADGYFRATLAGQSVDGGINGGENRLTILYTSKIKGESLGTFTINPFGVTGPNDTVNLLSYSGGPNSPIPVLGRTNIRIWNPTIKRNLSPTGKYANISYTSRPLLDYGIVIGFDPGIAGGPNQDPNAIQSELKEFDDTFSYIPSDITNNLNEKETGLTDSFKQKTLNTLNGAYSLNYDQIVNQTKYIYNNQLLDFRKTLHDLPEALTNDNPYEGPFQNYSAVNRVTLYNISSTNRIGGSQTANPNDNLKDSDKTNKLSVFTDKNTADEYANKDIIKFFFEKINPDGANYYLFFRAYLNKFADNYTADYQSYKYVGRADKFYRYNTFDRKIQLGFTIYAHTREEMIPMYARLNKLVDQTAPDYSGAGLMRGNILRLTIGDYLLGVPGIITSINLSPSFEAGWDINRKDSDMSVFGQTDTEFVGQLPKLIEVDLDFTPIHDFTPDVEAGEFDSPTATGYSFIRNINKG